MVRVGGSRRRRGLCLRTGLGVEMRAVQMRDYVLDLLRRAVPVKLRPRSESVRAALRWQSVFFFFCSHILKLPPMKNWRGMLTVLC